MYDQFQQIVSLTLLAALVVGCGQDSIRDLNSPDSLTLYSIDGNDYRPGEEPKTNESFHGYPVLGKVEVKDPENREAIIAALRKGIADSDGTMAKCFWPRHAIRTSENGKTTDYVVCFECLQLRIHADNATTIEATTDAPQPFFNKHLQDADVPLAPK